MGPVDNKYAVYLVLFTAVLGVSLAIFGESVFTDERPVKGTAAAIVFFFLYEILVMLVVNKRITALTPRQFVNLFMALRGVKIFLSLVFIAIYAVAFKVEAKRFALVFAALYALYLLFDTLYLSRNKK
jgi:hypothetical protein